MAAIPVRITIQGRPFGDWKQLTIARSLLNAAGGFAMTAVRTDPADFPKGAPVEIWWGKQPLLVGFIDSVERSLDSLLARVEGRAKTADLVDCSPDPKLDRSFFDIPLLKIVSTISGPFGIKTTILNNKIDLGDVKVRLGASANVPFPTFTIDSGETAWEAISRAARMRGVLAYEPGDGSVLVTRPGRERVPLQLVEGVNLLSATRKESDEERFSLYVVPGQRPGSDDESWLTVAAEAGSAVDKAIGRFRPLVVLPEASVSRETADLRAQWEATVRAADSDKVEVTVAGWTRGDIADPDAPLWRQNQLVKVSSPRLLLHEERLVKAITYQATIDDSEGTTATMQLVRRDAFSPKPVIEDADAELPDDDPPVGGG